MLLETIAPQRDLLVGQADQVALTGAGRRIVRRKMLELPDVEISPQFAVDPFQQIEVESFCDASLVVVRRDRKSVV